MQARALIDAVAPRESDLGCPHSALGSDSQCVTIGQHSYRLVQPRRTHAKASMSVGLARTLARLQQVAEDGRTRRFSHAPTQCEHALLTAPAVSPEEIPLRSAESSSRGAHLPPVPRTGPALLRAASSVHSSHAIQVCMCKPTDSRCLKSAPQAILMSARPRIRIVLCAESLIRGVFRLESPARYAMATVSMHTQQLLHRLHHVQPQHSCDGSAAALCGMSLRHASFRLQLKASCASSAGSAHMQQVAVRLHRAPLENDHASSAAQRGAVSLRGATFHLQRPEVRLQPVCKSTSLRAVARRLQARPSDGEDWTRSMSRSACAWSRRQRLAPSSPDTCRDLCIPSHSLRKAMDRLQQQCQPAPTCWTSSMSRRAATQLRKCGAALLCRNEPGKTCVSGSHRIVLERLQRALDATVEAPWTSAVHKAAGTWLRNGARRLRIDPGRLDYSATCGMQSVLARLHHASSWRADSGRQPSPVGASSWHAASLPGAAQPTRVASAGLLCVLARLQGSVDELSCSTSASARLSPSLDSCWTLRSGRYTLQPAAARLRSLGLADVVQRELQPAAATYCPGMMDAARAVTYLRQQSFHLVRASPPFSAPYLSLTPSGSLQRVLERLQLTSDGPILFVAGCANAATQTGSTKAGLERAHTFQSRSRASGSESDVLGGARCNLRITLVQHVF